MADKSSMWLSRVIGTATNVMYVIVGTAVLATESIVEAVKSFENKEFVELPPPPKPAESESGNEPSRKPKQESQTTTVGPQPIDDEPAGGDRPPIRDSRADLERKFRLEVTGIERTLRGLLPRPDYIGKDRRNIGELIEIAEETKKIGYRELNELRHVKRVRNALYHSDEHDVQDTELIEAIRFAEKWREVQASHMRPERR